MNTTTSFSLIQVSNCLFKALAASSFDFGSFVFGWKSLSLWSFLTAEKAEVVGAQQGGLHHGRHVQHRPGCHWGLSQEGTRELGLHI